MRSISITKCIVALLVILAQASKTAAHPNLFLNTTTGRVYMKYNKKLTVSVVWDQTAQDIVADLSVGPTIASGAFAAMHTAMYDAWSAYDPRTVSTNPTKDRLQRPASENTAANKRKAMSFAAYYTLVTNFPSRANVAKNRIVELGYDTTFADRPSRIGKRMAKEVLSIYNKNVLGKYSSYPFTTPVELWYPEHVPIDDLSAKLQKYLTPEWGRRRTFGVRNGKSGRPPAPEKFLLVDAKLNMERNTLSFPSGVSIPVDRSLIGTVINPVFISQAEEVIDYSVNLNDRKKVIAEFWESGMGTSFPPGMWLTFGQWVSARDIHSIDDDAKMFLALSNALSDAAITTWNAKKFYSYARPVRAIRDLGTLGLIGKYDDRLGGYAITAYNSKSGRMEKMLAESFNTYQKPNSEPSPPFPEYTSGHSAFSTSAAEVLRRYTGGDYFGASITLRVGKSRFEPGKVPRKKVTLRWKTFSQAAREAGISRLHGGIHFMDGNINGLKLGRFVGKKAFLKARRFFRPKRARKFFRPKRARSFFRSKRAYRKRTFK